MRKVLIVALVVGVIGLVAQTTIPLSSIRLQGQGKILAVVDGALQFVGLEGLTIDRTGESAVLKIVENQSAVEWGRTNYVIQGESIEVVIPREYNVLLVYRNGLLLSPAIDYDVLDGSRVVFVQANKLDKGDIVVLRYK